jgi:anti-sigma factor ChrR (cupin superfamily)
LSPGTHPSAAYLADFALGYLGLEPEVDVLAHLQVCGVCRAIVQAFEETEGRALDAIAPAAMADDAADRCLALIGATRPHAAPIDCD